jgi:hypothetical protein
MYSKPFQMYSNLEMGLWIIQMEASMCGRVPDGAVEAGFTNSFCFFMRNFHHVKPEVA